MERLLLVDEKRNPLFFNPNYYKDSVKELEEFLSGNNPISCESFAKKVMFSFEIQANNIIEGYGDSLQFIECVAENKESPNTNEEKVRRVINLHSGYQFILDNREIDKNSLKELYDILSKGLLTTEELNDMNDYYRNRESYIFTSSNTAVPPIILSNHKQIDYMMNKLFEFINSDIFTNTDTNKYIKSQLIHLYLVFIHPYFDVNGRTARTLAMWHILNEKIYPYIIFNRGIQFNKPNYYRTISDTTKFNNASYFIKFMLDNVKIELEKEYIIDLIKKSISSGLTTLDYQSIYYILSMRGLKTVSDFANYYNSRNDKIKRSRIFETMIDPLISKGILRKERDTNRLITPDTFNFIFDINIDKLNIDPSKVKKLNICKL